jgi:glutamate synthase domain-containing protein 3
MSGGVAFVLDEFEQLTQCNAAMVDLVPLVEFGDRDLRGISSSSMRVTLRSAKRALAQ